MDLAYLHGTRLVGTRRMTPEEMEAGLWTGHPPLVLMFEDGTQLYASRDYEGNGPGALLGVSGDGKELVA